MVVTSCLAKQNKSELNSSFSPRLSTTEPPAWVVLSLGPLSLEDGTALLQGMKNNHTSRTNLSKIPTKKRKHNKIIHHDTGII